MQRFWAISLLLFCLTTAEVGGREQRQEWWNSSYNYRIKATVDSGMYARKDYVLGVSIDFDSLLKSESIFDANFASIQRNVSAVVVDCESGQVIPFVFQTDVKNANTDVLKWLMEGKVEPVVEKEYFIYFSGRDSGIKAKPDFPSFRPNNDKGNLVENYSFEKDCCWQVRGDKQGQSFCQFSDRQAKSGSRSMVISNTNRKIPEYSSQSDIFEIEAGQRYSLSAWVRIDDTAFISGGTVIVAMYFLDENKKTKRPHEEEDYRMFFSISASPQSAVREDCPGIWLNRRISAEIPGWAKYGMIKVSSYYFFGTVYFDEIVVRKVRSEEPGITLGRLERYSNNP